jgi:hypothetical protein
VTGDVDKKIVTRELMRLRPRFTYCYEKALISGNGAMGGTLTVQFQIGSDGAVTAAKTSGITDAVIQTCAVTAIKSVEFPKPTNGKSASVQYAIELRPPGPPN